MSETTPEQSFSIPYVIEKTGRGERTYDLYSRLLEDRIVFIGTEVNDMVDNMSELIEPVMITILGGMVGTLVVAMYLPIFKMGSVV